MHAVKTHPEPLEPEPPREHHDERELADFIRDGAKRRPEQAFGDY
jgi:hypothetical protein